MPHITPKKTKVAFWRTPFFGKLIFIYACWWIYPTVSLGNESRKLFMVKYSVWLELWIVTHIQKMLLFFLFLFSLWYLLAYSLLHKIVHPAWTHSTNEKEGGWGSYHLAVKVNVFFYLFHSMRLCEVTPTVISSKIIICMFSVFSTTCIYWNRIICEHLGFSNNYISYSRNPIKQLLFMVSVGITVEWDQWCKDCAT